MLPEFSLSGSLVRLEPLSEHHVAALVAAASESRRTYGLARVPDGPAAMAEWVATAIEARNEGRHVPFAIAELASNRIVGSTRFHEMGPWQWPSGSRHQRCGTPDAVEIGHTWLAERVQQSGVNIEAKLLLMTYAFETWEVHRVRLRTDERNVRSRRAIEALGAVFDGLLRADAPGADDVVRNSAYYSVLASEWPEVKARLCARLERRLGKTA